MTFPQTSSIEAIRQGQEFWRLFTELESSGDIYESEQSSRAIVIGPNSDIARANVTYYDVQNNNIASNVSISVDKPLIGRLDALSSQTYQTGDRARILISSIDLAPPSGFRPPSAGVADPISQVTPKIDIYSYLNEQPGFIAPRTDRVHLFEQLPNFLSSAPQWYLVPFYGRRFAEITVKSLGFLAQPALTVNIYGINFSNTIADASLADNGHQEELLATMSFIVPGLGAGITDSVAISNRAFDYLAVEIDSSATPYPDSSAVTTHITVSDKI